MHARALAAASLCTPALRALEQAHGALVGSGDAEHSWLSPFDAAALASESALVLQNLELYDQALLQAESAVTLREDARTRSPALSRITLADIRVHRADLDAAVGVGNDLLSTSPTLGSIRVVRQLEDLRRALDVCEDYGPVREYLTRFDDARRARMLLLADIMAPMGVPTHEPHTCRPRGPERVSR